MQRLRFGNELWQAARYAVAAAIDVAANMQSIIHGRDAAFIHAVACPRKRQRRLDVAILPDQRRQFRIISQPIVQQTSTQQPVHETHFVVTDCPLPIIRDAVGQPAADTPPGLLRAGRSRIGKQTCEPLQVVHWLAGLVMADDARHAEPASFVEAIVLWQQLLSTSLGHSGARGKVGIQVAGGDFIRHALNAIRCRDVAEGGPSRSLPAEKRDMLYKGWKKAVTRTFDWVE